MSLRLNLLIWVTNGKQSSTKGDVMKKLCLMGAFLFSIFTAQSFADCGSYGGNYGSGDQGCGTPCCEQPCDQRTGECVCKYVRYIPCPYSITRCYQECIPYSVKCCRMVPQYYPVQRVRYVPEYYTVTCCRQVPEYYDVPKCYYVTRTYQEPHCTYRTCTYWKAECCNPCGNQGAPGGY